MKLLCISRKHPPSVGGMQQMNYELIRRLSRETDATVIKWGRSQAFLPIFIIWAILRSLFLFSPGRRPDVIYLGDALLAPLGLLLKLILHRPVAVTVHGLDITFPFPPYRAIVSYSLKRLDRIIGVSRHTAALCLKSGVRGRLCTTIHNAIDPEKHTPSDSDMRAARRWLIENGIELDSSRPLLITVGRLVQRKGITRFVQEALPFLTSPHPHLLYIIVGEGKERKAIETEIQRRHLTDNVSVAGHLPDNIVRGLMAMAKVFIMPNVRVDGDVEGFGIVALEAGCAGLPVVASDLEGIRDAVVDGENGFLIPPDMPHEFAGTVEKLLSDETGRKKAGERARMFTRKHYNWDRCTTLYMHEFRGITPPAAGDSNR